MVQIWEVVGGAGKGGIVVRADKDLSSAALPERLATGALLEEVKLEGDRLCYKRRTSTGPEKGWVSVKLKDKDLVCRTDKRPPPEWDPYGLLGIGPDATDAKIKSAFRKASLQVHPDRCPDDPEAAAKFRELMRARDFLLDPFKRFFYNLRHGLQQKSQYIEWWSDWDAIFDEVTADVDIMEALSADSAASPAPSLSSSADRIDVAIVGATGLTGTLAASIIGRQLPGKSWMIAGRDTRKLGLLEERLGKGAAGFRGAVRLDTNADLDRLAKSVRVVCDFTGPKWQVGAMMAEACVSCGTHYVEVTAEVTSLRQLKDAVEQKSNAAGVCVIGGGGINGSVMDMGTWFIVKHLRDRFGLPTRAVHVYMQVWGVHMSGSTLATGLAMDYKAVDARIKENGGPFFLGGVRPGGCRAEDEDNDDPVQDPYTGFWATCGSRDPNQFVVRASCGMFDGEQPYGDKFLFKNWNLHGSKADAEKVRMFAEWSKRFYKQNVEKKKMPPVGTGPGERLRQEAFCTRVFVAETDGGDHKAHLILTAGPGGCGDIYEGSATTVLEAAAVLLEAIGAGGQGLRAGFGTPSWHLAHLGFFERLMCRGFRSKVVEGAPTQEFLQNLFGSPEPALKELGNAGAD